MCVMPGSILSGYHHDPLRLEKYRESDYSVGTNVDTIWELPMSTFKNKAVVLGGMKTVEKSEYPISGRVYDEPDSYVECNYTLNKQGNRSAWTNKGRKRGNFWMSSTQIPGNLIKALILCQERLCFMSLLSYRMEHGLSRN